MKTLCEHRTKSQHSDRGGPAMLLYLAQLDFSCFVCRVVHKPRLKRSYVSMHIYTTYTHTHTHMLYALCSSFSKAPSRQHRDPSSTSNNSNANKCMLCASIVFDNRMNMCVPTTYILYIMWFSTSVFVFVCCWR